jgi:hypothetical protein
MATATTDGASRHRRNPANTRRTIASTQRPAKKPWTVSFPRREGLRYASLAGKNIAAAALVFGAICALIYTSAAPRKTMRAASEKHKTMVRQKTTTTNISARETKAAPRGLGSALVSKIDLPMRDGPRRDAKILDRAVYGSHVEILGQDGTWVQVRAMRKTSLAGSRRPA